MTRPSNKAEQSKAETIAPEVVEEEETTEAAPLTYVVVADTVMINVGEGADKVQRYNRGRVIEVNPAYNDVANLIRLKGIAPNDGAPKARTTPRALARAAGAADDPVQAPISAVVPEAPTAEQVADLGQ